MSYTPYWQNGNSQGLLDPAKHFARHTDFQEIVEAINMRRRLSYQAQQDFSTAAAGKILRKDAIEGSTSYLFDDLRKNLEQNVLLPPPGLLGGMPRSPEIMRWLWPIADSDENKVIVPTQPAAGEVNLFQKLNQTYDWTDPYLEGVGSNIRAIHWNELRKAVSWMRRGRWKMPIYFSAGLFSILADTIWFGEAIANNGSDELRTIGFSSIIPDYNPTLGLVNVSIRNTSAIQLLADMDCSVDIYHTLRGLDYVDDPPTWNQYDPSASSAWSTPGALGAGDAQYIGSMNLSANVAANLSSQAVTDVLQSMINGSQQNILVRRSDIDYTTVGITGNLIIEFDLNSPPN